MNIKNKLDVIVPDKYLKSSLLNPMDELFVGAIKSLRDQGKVYEFLGFNALNGHVVLIDGIKFYTNGNGVSNLETIAFERFFIVTDEGYDYIENRFYERVNQILDILKDIT